MTFPFSKAYILILYTTLYIRKMTKDRLGINIIIEEEKVGEKSFFIASSPDINVFAEGSTIEEVREKFVKAVKFHLEQFPEERQQLVVENKREINMPMLSKVFL